MAYLYRTRPPEGGLGGGIVARGLGNYFTQPWLLPKT
jgi:hypothetical protein